MYDYSTSVSWPYNLNSHFQLYPLSSAEITHHHDKSFKNGVFIAIFNI